MSARTALSEVLKVTLPAGKYRIIPAAFPPDNVVKPTVLVWQDNVRREPQIGHDRLVVAVTVWLLVGIEDVEKAETALEDGLEDLIDALRPITWANWEQAERLTFGDADGPTFHSYRITLTAHAQIGD